MNSANNFESNIISIYGRRGKIWLSKLASLVSYIQHKYRLSNLQPLENLSYNYVMKGTLRDQSVILKLSIDSLNKEAFILDTFKDHGAVKVLFHEEQFMILEALSGPSLRFYFMKYEEESIKIVANVIVRLHSAPILGISGIPHIRDWLRVLDDDLDIPIQYIQKARRLKDILLNEAGQDVLLHGDLHHDNVLKDDNEWLIIDPKGVIGESAYEIAAFIRNPIPELLDNNPLSIIRYRIDAFAVILKIPPYKIKNWCFVQAVLALAWAVEDDCNINIYKQLVQIFDSM